jgi:hypothetical protein
VVEPPADGVEITGCDLVDIGFPRQKPADTAVRVFVGSFLPRRAGSVTGRSYSGKSGSPAMTSSSSIPPASTERYNKNAVMGGLSGQAADLIVALLCANRRSKLLKINDHV